MGLSVSNKMFKQLLTIVSIIYQAIKVNGECKDTALDYCIEYPPFQTLRLSSDEKCQQLCSQIFPNVCTFFIHDRQQDLCQIFDYDYQEYVKSCNFISGTPTPSLTECQALGEKCLVRFYTACKLIFSI